MRCTRSAVLATALAMILGTGTACEISPVISDPGLSEDRGGRLRGGRYDDCRRAAKDYCRQVRGAEGDALDRCVAEAVYDCVRGAAR